MIQINVVVVVVGGDGGGFVDCIIAGKFYTLILFNISEVKNVTPYRPRTTERVTLRSAKCGRRSASSKNLHDGKYTIYHFSVCVYVIMRLCMYSSLSDMLLYPVNAF